MLTAWNSREVIIVTARSDLIAENNNIITNLEKIIYFLSIPL